MSSVSHAVWQDETHVRAHVVAVCHANLRLSLRNRLFLLTTAVEVDASGSVERDSSKRQRLLLAQLYPECIREFAVPAYLRQTCWRFVVVQRRVGQAVLVQISLLSSHRQPGPPI